MLPESSPPDTQRPSREAETAGCGQPLGHCECPNSPARVKWAFAVLRRLLRIRECLKSSALRSLSSVLMCGARARRVPAPGPRRAVGPPERAAWSTSGAGPVGSGWRSAARVPDLPRPCACTSLAPSTPCAVQCSPVPALPHRCRTAQHPGGRGTGQRRPRTQNPRPAVCAQSHLPGPGRCARSAGQYVERPLTALRCAYLRTGGRSR
jgi:hypothetical protein